MAYDPYFGGPAPATCVPADCRIDSNCASGECGVAHWFDGCSVQNEVTCRDPQLDTCEDDSDCAFNSMCGISPFGGTGAFECSSEDCAVGRPFLVDGLFQSAPLVSRIDWLADMPSKPMSADLAEHWARIGALEHASVASFARVTLQLMALGAPPEIIAETQQASIDEVRHAQLCFGLASAYAGREMGPGRFPLTDVGFDATPEAVLVSLIEEACVQETLAAAQAHVEAERATDADVKAVLTTIAEDESRHAELAWKTLGWMVATFPELRELARTTLEGALAQGGSGDAAPGLHAPDYGILGPNTRREVRMAAAESVLRPCADALAA